MAASKSDAVLDRVVLFVAEDLVEADFLVDDDFLLDAERLCFFSSASISCAFVSDSARFAAISSRVIIAELPDTFKARSN